MAINARPVHTPRSPNLMIAPVDYEQRYQNLLNDTLRLYFNQIDNAVGQLIRTMQAPGYTTTDRNLIANPFPGQLIFNLTTLKLNFYDGVGWREVTSV
jgi:hypothetical protein